MFTLRFHFHHSILICIWFFTNCTWEIAYWETVSISKEIDWAFEIHFAKSLNLLYAITQTTCNEPLVELCDILLNF